MFRLIARLMVKRTLRAHASGDVEGVLRSYAKDVVFRFPGNNSWAGTYRGIDQVRPWLERFHRVGLKIDFDEILIGGWPWDTKVALHFTDHLTAPDGSRVYENTGFIYARARWGKIHTYEVIEDTEKVAAADEWLAVNEPSAP